MAGKVERLIPAERAQAEMLVVNSRFIASLAPAFSVEEARAFIAEVRQEHAEATHHVPAFVIGHGASLITHCSDDGEPSGTAGRPALAVLQGSRLGDAVVVVIRYFGGTKLGTGGLVRAYSDAVRAVLAVTPVAEKTLTHTVFIEMPYSYFEQVRLLVGEQGGVILEQDFAAQVAVTARFRPQQLQLFQAALRELSRDKLRAEIIETNPATIVPRGHMAAT